MGRSLVERAILHGSRLENYRCVKCLSRGLWNSSAWPLYNKIAAAQEPCRASRGLDPSTSLRAGSRGRPSPHDLFSSPALSAAWGRTLVLAGLPAAATCFLHAQSSIRAPRARHGLLLSPASAERSSPGSSRL